jgi:hypothetical protein
MTQLTLSRERFLVYVLRRSNDPEVLVSGGIERTGSDLLNVYDEQDVLLDYYVRHVMRSWCVFDQAGKPFENWRHVVRMDIGRLLARAIWYSAHSS